MTMRISVSALLNVALASILVASLFFMAIAKTGIDPATVSAAEYDPWLDSNDDGVINMLDIYYPALAFGAAGDPTKKVNVMNWPVSEEVTVWFANSSYPLNSTVFDASGFNYLRVFLGVLWAGAPSSIDFRIYGVVWNITHEKARSFIAYQTTVAYPRNSISFAIPVPSDNFFFTIYLLEGVGDIYLSYCLTWT